MNRYKSIGLSVAVIATLGFTGCGGSDGDSSGSSSTSSPSNGSSGASFPSNAVVAAPTLENGQEVEKVVAQNQQSAYSINAVNTSNHQNVALTMKTINDKIQKLPLSTYSLNETVNETEQCLEGGSVNYNGSGSDTGGISLTVTFNNCNEYGLTMNGSIFSTASNYNNTFDDYTKVNTTMLSDFTVSETGFSSKILEGSTTNIEYSDIVDLYTANKMKLSISAISEINGIQTGQKDAVYFFDTPSYSNSSMYQTAGKIYINNLNSYVTYDSSYDMSLTPFVFDYYSISSGEARYIMADGGKMRVVAEYNEAKTYVDADGDGYYELSEW